MKFRDLVPTLALSILALSASPASAQDLNQIMQQNMAFDQQQFGMIQNQMAQNQMQQQQLMQMYIQQNGPRLQQEYQQFVASTGAQIPFQTFVYNHMLTQGGANPGPALQAQQNNFRALQDANRTQQQGFEDYNRGWAANQQRLDNTANRYDQGAIRGNGYFQNPQTGETHELPYGAQPGFYGNNNNNFANDPSGNWHQVDPQGYGQQLQQVDPPDGGWDD